MERRTKKEVADLITNTLNHEFSLELKTIDSFAMSERIQTMIDMNIINPIREYLMCWKNHDGIL